MFPAYLLTDQAFWLFGVLYVLSIALTVALLLVPAWLFSLRPNVRRYLPTFIPIFFTLLLIYQFFHQAEHVTQMYQFQFLGFSPHDARGFVWFLDDEWNHFVFNIGYMLGMSVIFFYLLRALKRSNMPFTLGNSGIIVFFLLMEGWHCIEHTYRIVHHVQGLCTQCDGILDQVTGINRLLIHFWFNFLALVLPAAVYCWYNMSACLWKRKTSIPQPI